MTSPLVEVPGRLVAEVVVDTPLAHLDRHFDYLVPDELVDKIAVGCRVQVRFAGQLLDGLVLELKDHTDFPGELDTVRHVVSPERVLTSTVQRLIRRVADHYAGVWWDVARLAIPPRAAAVEEAAQRQWPQPSLPEPSTLINYPDGPTYLAALQRGASPRAAWQAAPAHTPLDMAAGVVDAASATLASGRSVVVLVPTYRELERVLPRFQAAFGADAVAEYAAEQGRSSRYRNFLAMARGQARIVVGTRSAVFAPLAEVGLIAVLDEGSDHYVEQRAPYWHARTVAVLRASQDNAAVLLASHARSVAAQDLVQRGWLHEMRLPPTQLRRLAAPVRTVSEHDRERDPTAAKLRLPSVAFRFLERVLPLGPVLVQVPMRGDAASLACTRCYEYATCPKCDGRLRSFRRDEPECTFCGHRPVRWECRRCHGTRLRVPLPGAKRTADELARAFPGTLAINSSGERIRDEVSDASAIVVATPGAEPNAVDGYAGALLLDAEVSLGRADFRAGEEALRRWSNALALVRPAEREGQALIVGAHLHPCVQALARSDAVGQIERELELRRETRLPPTVRVARVAGELDAVQAFLGNVDWPMAELLGPSEVGEGRWAALLRAGRESGGDFVRQVKSAAAARSTKKQAGILAWQVDPEVF
ncbi:hypothetical protein [Tessaracoccus sp. OH4464_COT-324]|uniref:primosomal protein N' family DNA-binding protein n=1 Tax=Tessaracoccus sp. OH4464_COT-324 TaxID=2491059 RepID=UPI000F6329DB|nr:hypothetical protein [Tessaracoccus sp. OH4464_COT-324]RRD47978.1 hypothetical protein EII42_01660 [Tessaracoccus sp. OH4464_COT-324]